MTIVKAVVEIAVQYDQPGNAVSDQKIKARIRSEFRTANTGIKVNDLYVLRWVADSVDTLAEAEK